MTMTKITMQKTDQAGEPVPVDFYEAQMRPAGEAMIGDNPRYAAYARAHGRTPEAMLEHDRAEFPGGCMAGFIAWMSKQNAAFFLDSPGSFVGCGRIGDQAAWTAFLELVGGTQA